MKYYICAFCLLGMQLQGLDMKSQEVLSQMSKVSPQDLAAQRAAIFAEEVSFGELSTFNEFEKSGSLENKEKGAQLLAEGKVGCLIVAGGQGSRLNYVKPKGLYPVSLIKQKSLFQLFAERILAAGRLAGSPLWVAVMTSPGNHEETVQSFEENGLFGLSKEQLFFFCQEELPLLDPQGNLFLETPEKLATGPDGNASSLKHFVSSGIWDTWHKAGIAYLNYMHIDNALVDPFDAELTGYHAKNQASDLIVKCIERTNPLEKLGVLFKENEKVVVVEYSEISSSERDARKEDGSLKNACANIGLYSFTMDFVREVGLSYYDKLPFHKAWKAVKYLTPEGMTQMASKPMAWKFEKFIFDVFFYAKGIKALLCPREECFAPLKNAEGDDSLLVVQHALQKRDKQVFEKVSGVFLGQTHPFELDPAFYYPSQELLDKWKQKSLPDSSYIDP